MENQPMIEMFHTMYDNFPTHARLIRKNREVLPVNKIAEAEGLRAGVRLCRSATAGSAQVLQGESGVEGTSREILFRGRWHRHVLGSFGRISAHHPYSKVRILWPMSANHIHCRKKTICSIVKLRSIFRFVIPFSSF